MKTIGNILWLVLAGIELAVGYFLAGILSCLLVITIPFGIQSFKLATYSLWPFGRVVIDKPDRGTVTSGLGNLVWLVVAGWWLALGHVLVAVVLFATIIGIPFGWANLKLARLALWPFGTTVVPAEVAEQMGVTPRVSVPSLGE